MPLIQGVDLYDPEISILGKEENREMWVARNWNRYQKMLVVFKPRDKQYEREISVKAEAV